MILLSEICHWTKQAGRSPFKKHMNINSTVDIVVDIVQELTLMLQDLEGKTNGYNEGLREKAQKIDK